MVAGSEPSAGRGRGHGRVGVEAEATLAQDSFQYLHQNVWKTGYYDSTSRIFLGSMGGKVTTVIKDASLKYINNLKAAKP